MKKFMVLTFSFLIACITYGNIANAGTAAIMISTVDDTALEDEFRRCAASQENVRFFNRVVTLLSKDSDLRPTRANIMEAVRQIHAYHPEQVYLFVAARLGENDRLLCNDDSEIGNELFKTEGRYIAPNICLIEVGRNTMSIGVEGVNFCRVHIKDAAAISTRLPLLQNAPKPMPVEEVFGKGKGVMVEGKSFRWTPQIRIPDNVDQGTLPPGITYRGTRDEDTTDDTLKDKIILRSSGGDVSPGTWVDAGTEVTIVRYRFREEKTRPGAATGEKYRRDLFHRDLQVTTKPKSTHDRDRDNAIERVESSGRVLGPQDEINAKASITVFIWKWEPPRYQLMRAPRFYPSEESKAAEWGPPVDALIDGPGVKLFEIGEEPRILWRYRDSKDLNLMDRVLFSKPENPGRSLYVIIQGTKEKDCCLHIRDIRGGKDYSIAFPGCMMEPGRYTPLATLERHHGKTILEIAAILKRRSGGGYVLKHLSIDRGSCDPRVTGEAALGSDLQPAGIALGEDRKIVLAYQRQGINHIACYVFGKKGKIQPSGDPLNLGPGKVGGRPFYFSDEYGEGVIGITQVENAVKIHFSGGRDCLDGKKASVPCISSLNGTICSIPQVFSSTYQGVNYYYLGVLTQDEGGVSLSYFKFTTQGGGRFLEREVNQKIKLSLGEDETIYMNLIAPPMAERYYFALSGRNVRIFRYGRVSGTDVWRLDGEPVQTIDFPSNQGVMNTWETILHGSGSAYYLVFKTWRPGGNYATYGLPLDPKREGKWNIHSIEPGDRSITELTALEDRRLILKSGDGSMGAISIDDFFSGEDPVLRPLDSHTPAVTEDAFSITAGGKRIEGHFPPDQHIYELDISNLREDVFGREFRGPVFSEPQTRTVYVLTESGLLLCLRGQNGRFNIPERGWFRRQQGRPEPGAELSSFFRPSGEKCTVFVPGSDGLFVFTAAPKIVALYREGLVKLCEADLKSPVSGQPRASGNTVYFINKRKEIRCFQLQQR